MIGNDRDWHGEIKQKIFENNKRYVIEQMNYKKKLKIDYINNYINK